MSHTLSIFKLIPKTIILTPLRNRNSYSVSSTNEVSVQCTIPIQCLPGREVSTSYLLNVHIIPKASKQHSNLLPNQGPSHQIKIRGLLSAMCRCLMLLSSQMKQIVRQNGRDMTIFPMFFPFCVYFFYFFFF